MSDPPATVTSGALETPTVTGAASLGQVTSSSTPVSVAQPEATPVPATVQQSVAAAPPPPAAAQSSVASAPTPVQTVAVATGSGSGTPASTPTPTSTPSTPMANTPTPLQQQFPQLDQQQMHQQPQQQQQLLQQPQQQQQQQLQPLVQQLLTQASNVQLLTPQQVAGLRPQQPGNVQQVLNQQQSQQTQQMQLAQQRLMQPQLQFQQLQAAQLQQASAQQQLRAPLALQQHTLQQQLSTNTSISLVPQGTATNTTQAIRPQMQYPLLGSFVWQQQGLPMRLPGVAVSQSKTATALQTSAGVTQGTNTNIQITGKTAGNQQQQQQQITTSTSKVISAANAPFSMQIGGIGMPRGNTTPSGPLRFNPGQPALISIVQQPGLPGLQGGSQLVHLNPNFVNIAPLITTKPNAKAGKGVGPRTTTPGSGRRIEPKGGLPETTKVRTPANILSKPKKQSATSKAQVTTATATSSSEPPQQQQQQQQQATKAAATATVTKAETTNPKPPATPTQKADTSTPTAVPQVVEAPAPFPPPPVVVVKTTIPPLSTLEPLVTSQSPMNGSTTVLSSAGTNGTITVAAETQPVPPKTEPMEVDKAVSKEENSVEMADESEDGGRGKLQAVVKPQIIRHIIDGFMIEEAAEAFPVEKSLLMSGFFPGGVNLSDRSDSDSVGPDGFRKERSIPPDAPKKKCEFCGKLDYAQKFRRSGRFCSIPCAKRFNVGCSKRVRTCNSQNGHTPTGGKYIKKRKTPEIKKKWKRQEGGRVTTGPIQRAQSQLSELGGWSSTASEAASELTTEDESRSTTDETTTPNEGSPPPPVLEREESVSLPMSAPAAGQSSRQKEGASTGGLIVIQPSEGALGDSQSSATSTSSLSAVSPRPAAATSPACHRRHPSTWNVADVYEFIHTLPGCTPYADEFRSQEIDGQALMLLKEDHLMSAMNMKLGPALKICAKITALKEEHS